VRGRELQVLGGIVALAALVRFATLDEQSYWYDEAVTVGLIRMDFGGMLDQIPESESTPPLYYAVAWLWAKVFGTGEIGLRSLSALCGTAFVPVAYAIGARAVGARVGLVAAGLAAANPLLVWYSQEARAYALLVLLAGLSFLFFVHLLTGDPRRRTLVLWALFSALALATHYFAAFLVAIEAIWLLATAANRRPVAVALAALTAVELAHLPLLLHQRSLNLADFIDEIPLGHRLARTPKQFLVGFDAPWEVATAVAAGLLVLLSVWFVWSRGDDRERRTALIGAAVGGGLLLATGLLAIIGVDYFDTRNVLVAWPPLAVAVAAGLGAQRAARAGIVAAVALALVGTSTVASVMTQESFQRDNWRGVAAALGQVDPSKPRALVITPFTAAKPFAVYAPEFEPMPEAGVSVNEVDFVALPVRHRTQSKPGPPPRPGNHPPPSPGFSLIDRRMDDTFTLLRYASPTTMIFTPKELAGAHFDPTRKPAVFIER
jgi:4-amino-4-deoxy-L-arabinose transferase-like glycosyltransferase